MSIIPSETAFQISDLCQSPPIDIGAVAARLGTAVYAMPLAQGVSGVLLKEAAYGSSSGFVIFVNPNEALVRQRFTAAHEIGHLVLHRHRIGDRTEENYLLRSDRLSDRIEVEANKFAADLLMPMNLLRSAIEAGSRDVKALADLFQVSEIAMGIRLGHPT